MSSGKIVKVNSCKPTNWPEGILVMQTRDKREKQRQRQMGKEWSIGLTSEKKNLSRLEIVQAPCQLRNSDLKYNYIFLTYAISKG